MAYEKLTIFTSSKRLIFEVNNLRRKYVCICRIAIQFINHIKICKLTGGFISRKGGIGIRLLLGCDVKTESTERKIQFKADVM